MRFAHGDRLALTLCARSILLPHGGGQTTMTTTAAAAAKENSINTERIYYNVCAQMGVCVCVFTVAAGFFEYSIQ